ncbi:MAG: 6-phosphogluconolactonase [Nitrosomonadales bacterium]|nr:6-phosphogluconolactonase [Nitrosomonadales bacterium]
MDVPQICHWHGYETTAALERSAVCAILETAESAIRQRGDFHLVLAGGTTPRRVYAALSQSPANWGHWHIYFGDERCLPPAHAERNSQMAHESWLTHVAIPATNIHTISAELGAREAAQRYAAKLASVGEFDLVLLGLGEDGHTASLFPGHEAGEAADAPDALAVFDAPKPPPERVSLSAHRLSYAKRIVFLVTGAGKHPAVQAWRNGELIPAARITPPQGVEIWLEQSLL